MIRIGTIVNGREPSYKGFKKVVVMMKSSKYYSLSPYALRNDNGLIMENCWQFSKIYKTIPHNTVGIPVMIKQSYGAMEKKHLWTEQHIVTPQYEEWRQKGYNNPYAVRYPAGRNHRHQCLGMILPTDNPVGMNIKDVRLYNYIEAVKCYTYPLIRWLGVWV